METSAVEQTAPAPTSASAWAAAPIWLRTALIALAILALALGVATRLTAPAPNTTPQLIGHASPAFTLTAVSDGQTQPAPVTLAAQRGHPTLLLFFSSLCSHCLSETETVRQLEAQEAAQGLRVLHIDSPAEALSIITAYQQRVGISAPTLLDARGSVAAHYGVRYYPTVVLIDSGGIVRDSWSGEAPAGTLTAAISALK